MKNLSLLCILTCSLFNGCTDTLLNPSTEMIFWISYDNGCGSTRVYIDGEYSGEITHWQSNGPSTCHGSYTLLKVSGTQGEKTVEFSNACGSMTRYINVDDNCYIYRVY